MVKLVNLKKSKEDNKVEKDAVGGPLPSAMNPDDAGLRLDLDHHHLEKLGVGNMDHGDKVHFEGHGTVERVESHSQDGKARNSATIRFHKGGMDHEQPRGEPQRDKSEIRGDLEKSYAGVHEKALPDKKSASAAK